MSAWLIAAAVVVALFLLAFCFCLAIVILGARSEKYTGEPGETNDDIIRRYCRPQGITVYEFPSFEPAQVIRGPWRPRAIEDADLGADFDWPPTPRGA